MTVASAMPSYQATNASPKGVIGSVSILIRIF
jgi:hypothetical protein